MCLRQSRVRLTAKEAFVAEESLSVYCKPVELYNILQRRAIKNPPFLQRCLDYKIRAKRKRRIQITVSFSRALNAELEPHNVFPLHALIARPIADVTSGEHSAIYRLNRAAILSTFSELGKNDQTQAQFVIPEIKKLRADAQFGNLIIIIISHVEREGAYHENHCLKIPEELKSFSSKLEGNCLMGKLPLEPLYSLLEKRVTSSLEHIAEMQSTVNFLPSIFEPTNLDKDNFLAFRTQNADSMSSYQVQVSLSAQGIGAREKSPYDSYTYDGVPTSSLPHIIRLRTGNVIFNYRYYNNTLQKTEVTEDFCCPFCLVQCASFKGLRCHLISFHDLFNFEFWVTEEFQAVNVSVRTGAWGSEVVSSGVDPRLQTFDYCSKLKRRRITKNPVQNVNNVHPHFLESESPGASRDGSHKGQLQKEDDTYSPHRPITHPRDVRLPNGLNDSCSSREEKSSNELLDGKHKLESYVSENHLPSESKECFVSSPKITGICAISDQAFTSNESGSNLAPTTILQFAKTRKLSVERGDPRNRALLQKRPFFHSHRAQPMALEQVFSDRDSEDEVDDDIADFEDRKMLDDFVDVTTYEKQIMHLWNSFVRKQRVLADGHIPWACEAFSRLHGLDLVRVPALLRCWRLLMVKLWNHSLLDARTMNNCSLILETCQDEGFCPEEGTVLAKTGVRFVDFSPLVICHVGDILPFVFI